MLCYLLCTAFFALGAVADLLSPALPTALARQTPVQAQILAKATATAKADYATGVADLMTMLKSPYLTKVLTEFDDGSNLQALTADELFNRLKAELDVAELVHNFGAGADGKCGADITIESGPKLPYLYSQWMLQVLGYTPFEENISIEKSETLLLQFPAFATASKPDAATAGRHLHLCLM